MAPDSLDLDVRCARLLWEAYRARDEQGFLRLDGAVADAAEMPDGTDDYRVCVDMLKHKERAIVEEPVLEEGGVRGKVYSITSRGFELLSEAGYILGSA
jgi:hypothetical protein